MLGCTCDMWWSDLWPRADTRQFGLCCCCLSVILSTLSMWLQFPITTSCCLTGGVSSQVSVMLMRIVDKPIWFWVWYHPSLQRALKFVIILWFSFIRFKMLTFSIKISCKYLDYNKKMFCAYEIDIYHVPTSYSQTITVSWMLHFRGLILPLLTASDWHGEWRRWPEAELAWLRGLGPPP